MMDPMFYPCSLEGPLINQVTGYGILATDEQLYPVGLPTTAASSMAPTATPIT